MRQRHRTLSTQKVQKIQRYTKRNHPKNVILGFDDLVAFPQTVQFGQKCGKLDISVSFQKSLGSGYWNNLLFKCVLQLGVELRTAESTERLYFGHVCFFLA
jgi:hypothetical protein